LVVGGAGFIGSHLADALVNDGARVRVLDNLLEQAHPTGEPRFVPPQAEFVYGDVRDRATVERALADIDVVFHLAGMVGNGQSMYDIVRYTDVNVGGTANLIECMLGVRAEHRPGRLVLSSSMVVYGDGAYACPSHGRLDAVSRPRDRLIRKQWEPVCPRCGDEVQPVATSETHALCPTSTYGTSKRAQEELALVLGRAHKLPTIALRYLNTYGSRQAMSNPYTGVAALMASRVRNGKRPLIFEDGLQLRDFIHVSDVVRAKILAARAPDQAQFHAYNIGTGQSRPIGDIARLITTALSQDIEPEVTGGFREGDIRHCFADISRAREAFGFAPRMRLEEGMQEFLTWARSETPIDHTDAANRELRARGLLW
jgi:dTDP-L-rhamnose 4-epimerase